MDEGRAAYGRFEGRAEFRSGLRVGRAELREAVLKPGQGRAEGTTGHR
jgi:hypothetical protein